jgi:hypothetical protein
MQQIRKRHEFQVKNVETLDFGWCVCVCVCVVVSLAALPVRYPVCSGGLVVSVYDTHEADTLGRN